MGRFGNKKAARERDQQPLASVEMSTSAPDIADTSISTLAAPPTTDEAARPLVGATAAGELADGVADDLAAMRSAMARALQKPKREQIQTVILRMPSDLLKAIDKAKGEASRNQFFIELARLYVKSTVR